MPLMRGSAQGFARVHVTSQTRLISFLHVADATGRRTGMVFTCLRCLWGLDLRKVGCNRAIDTGSERREVMI